MNREWQPAIIASHEHVETLHTGQYGDPGAITRFAGQRIWVRLPDPKMFAEWEVGEGRYKSLLGCKGQCLEVDTNRGGALWPDLIEKGATILLCTCMVHVD
jgi:hypothetical protein